MSALTSTNDVFTMKRFLRNHFATVGDRLAPMEGMRGFAALLVFFVHFNALFHGYFEPGPTRQLCEIVGSLGHTGVDVFFVLSGFLIYGIVFNGKQTYGQFLLHRVRRLYPVFLVVLFLYLTLSLAFPLESKLPKSVPSALLYVAANAIFLPGMTRITPIIVVAWSLSYEWFFYLLIPVVISGLRLGRWRSWQRIVFFLLFALMACLLRIHIIAGHQRWVLFASGIVLWEMVSFHKLRFRTGRWGEIAAIVAFVLNLVFIGWVGARNGETGLVLSRVGALYVPSLFVTAFFLSLYSFFFDGVLKALFSWDYLRWVGNISYSYYLIHGLTLHGVRLALGFFFPQSPRHAVFVLALLVTCVAATLLSAAVLFITVEKPLSFRKSASSEPKEIVIGAASRDASAEIAS
jgi:exopolysaccharide production protein ExoZ